MAAMPIYGKTFKNLLLQNQIIPSALMFAQILGDRWSTKIAKMMVLCWNLLPHAFIWAIYIYIESIEVRHAYLQWLCHSGERAVAHGPLVLRSFSDRTQYEPVSVTSFCFFYWCQVFVMFTKKSRKSNSWFASSKIVADYIVNPCPAEHGYVLSLQTV